MGPVTQDRKSLTLPVSRNRAGILHARLQQLGTLENAHTFNNSKANFHMIRSGVVSLSPRNDSAPPPTLFFQGN